MTNIEKHLNSHNINMLEYRCGVCNKLWPSWRSVITHYSKSNCRHATTTSTTSPSLTTSTQTSSNIIDQISVENESTKPSTMNTVIDETSETDEQVDATQNKDTGLVEKKKAKKKVDKQQQHSPSVVPKEKKKKKDDEQKQHSPSAVPKEKRKDDKQQHSPSVVPKEKKKDDKQQHSPSVVPKEKKKDDKQQHSPSVVPKEKKKGDKQQHSSPVIPKEKKKDDKQQHSPSAVPKEKKNDDLTIIDDDQQTILSINSRNDVVDSKKTGTGNLYYCNLCASGGWEKQVSLSQHMRHMHKAEYNATIEIPMKKKRWTRDDMIVLAELELCLSSSEKINTNSALAAKFPSRSREAIKLRRQTSEYKSLLRHVRESQLAVNIEGSDNSDSDSDSSTALDEITTGNGSICTIDNNNNRNNDDPNDNVNNNNNNNDVLARRGIDTTTYPDIRKYIKDKIIDGRVQVCPTMSDALLHFVNDVFNSDPVRESLNGIHEALDNVQSSKTHNGEKQTAGSKSKSARTMRKAQRYAHYQRLFKKDKSKLASEIFDGVDNSAVKPPMSVAYEHYRKIWTNDTIDAGKIDYKASVGSDILLAPITREEITLAIKLTNNSTALGPDHVPLVDINKIAKKELWCAFNIWIGLRRIPDLLKINRTVLLPKGKDDLANIKNWRPITIASLLIRLYNKILARRMQSVFRTNSRQTGFKPVNGVGQNVALLHNLLRHARTNKNNLFVCLLDVSKAFDSVPHGSIKRALIRNSCPPDFVELFSNQYENSYTALSYTDRSSQLIALKRGVKQGDPMSSILFNLVIDELFEIIGDRFAYELEGIGSVNARAFADDIALVSGSETGMQQLLSETEKFLNARGLDLNVDKCISICLRKAGKAKKSQIADSSVMNPPKFTVKNKLIQLLGIDQICRYLGVQFTPLGAVDSRVTVAELKSALSSLAKAPLKPQQKIVMLRTYLIPRFIFSFTHTECYPKLMGQQDRLIRRWLKATLKLPSSICSDFFYLPIKEGGLGIGKLYDIIGIAKVRLHNSFHKAGDECLKYLVETQGSAMFARWCNAMKLSNRPSAADINSRNVLTLNESRNRLSDTVHGSGSTVFRASPITNQWLSGQTRIMKGGTYIRAIQMRTNTTPTRVSTSRGRDSIKTCRRCGLADETLVHIVQTCPITQGMRCRRHNNVCRKVSEKLRSKGFQVYSEQGLPSPGLQTNISRPDIIATSGDQALVLDVTCVFESNSNSFKDAYRRKVNRYEPLVETIKQKYKVKKVEFHGLIVGSRGAYDQTHLTLWHRIGFSGTELAVLAIGVIEDSLRVITLFNNANRLRI